MCVNLASCNNVIVTPSLLCDSYVVVMYPLTNDIALAHGHLPINCRYKVFRMMPTDLMKAKFDRVRRGCTGVPSRLASVPTESAHSGALLVALVANRTRDLGRRLAG